MKKFFLGICLFLVTQNGYALLSPLNQSIEEMRAILQSPEIEKHLPQGRPILEIQRMGNGYMLFTKELQLQIEMEYLPATQLGKQSFKLHFHAPTAREHSHSYSLFN